MWYLEWAMKRLIPLIILVFVLTAVFIGLLIYYISRPGEPAPTPTPVVTPTIDPHAGEIEVRNPSGGTMWVPEAPDLAAFGLECTDFTVDNQIPYYQGEGLTMRRGIDVSEHQSEIDWQAVADYGIEFAFIRSGYRSYGDGELHEDLQFQKNIQGALEAGLDVGVYFFSQALNIVEAAEEAVYVIHQLEDYEITLPVFFDWEKISVEPARTDNVAGETITACALEFCKLIEAGGYESGIYTFLNMAYYIYSLNELEDITIWMGDPGTMPIFYFDHDYWQYSITGAVPGIDVDVDLDAMYVRDADDQTVSESGAIG